MAPRRLDCVLAGFTSWSQYDYSRRGGPRLGNTENCTMHPYPSCLREALVAIEVRGDDNITQEEENNVIWWRTQVKGAAEKTDFSYYYTGVNDETPAFLFSKVVDKISTRLRQFDENFKHVKVHDNYSTACDLINEGKMFKYSGFRKSSIFTSGVRSVNNIPSMAYLRQLLDAAHEFDLRSSHVRDDWNKCVDLLDSIAVRHSLEDEDIFQYYLALDSVQMAHHNWPAQNTTYVSTGPSAQYPYDGQGSHGSRGGYGGYSNHGSRGGRGQGYIY